MNKTTCLDLTKIKNIHFLKSIYILNVFVYFNHFL